MLGDIPNFHSGALKVLLHFSKLTECQEHQDKGGASTVLARICPFLDLGPYSPTILEKVLRLILQIFLYLDAFECNTTSDWLNRMV